MGAQCIKHPQPIKQTAKSRTIVKNSQKMPQFAANIRELHKQYVKHVLHVRNTRLFAQKTERLQNGVKQYFKAGYKFDKDNLDLASIDSVRKLHPKQYWENKIDQQWLINACLRQQKFSNETKVQSITFNHAYPEYIQFLRLCRYNYIQRNGAIAVPTKCQDVIWHSHMQDADNYKADMIRMMGKLLNHMDDIPQQDLKKHAERTKQLYKQAKNRPKQEKNQPQNYINLNLTSNEVQKTIIT